MRSSRERPECFLERCIARVFASLIVCMACGAAPGWAAGGEPDPLQGRRSPFIITVAIDGSGDYTSIQAAIDSGNPGKTVLVGPGVYKEPIRMRAGVDVQGSGADKTILDGRGARPVVRGASYCRLDGFTITGYADYDLDGVYCQDVNDLTISNNIIKNNTWSGIHAVRSSIIVRNNVIYGNRCAGIFVTYAAPKPSVIANNTIWDNSNEADIAVWWGGNALIVNNIVQDIDCDEESTATVRWNDVVAPAVGGDSICVDPFFADPDAGDFHLKSQAGRWDPKAAGWVMDDVTSPCIDAGDPMSAIGFEPFPNGGIVNLGAYGGTVEASKSWFGGPVCTTIIAGDINGDCRVDFADFRIMALHWLQKGPSSDIIDRQQ